MEVLHHADGALTDGGDRIVVSPAHGRLTVRPPSIVTTEGEWVEAGQVIAEIAASDDAVEIHAPCRGYLVAMLAEDGDRVRPGTPLAHLESV